MTEKTDLAINASIDIGDNLTQILEKLAGQIGTTADKIFPWYVSQQVIEGWTFLLTGGISLIVGLVLVLMFYKKADFDNGNRYTFLTVVGLLLSIIFFITLSVDMPEIITKIANPNYYALQAMISDIARITGK